MNNKENLKNLTSFIIESNAIEMEYSQQAFEDSLKAWDFIMQQKYGALNAIMIETMHRVMIQNINPGIAGIIRNGEVSIGGYLALPSFLVKEKLLELLQFVPTLEEEIKDWHIRYEAIHPFFDGNGRSGRHIMNWQRVCNDLPILVIHEDIDDGEEQLAYYKWFKK